MIRQLDSEDRLRFDWAKFGDGEARLKQFTMTGRGTMQALNYPLSIITSPLFTVRGPRS
jgi:hypothetical protein